MSEKLSSPRQMIDGSAFPVRAESFHDKMPYNENQREDFRQAVASTEAVDVLLVND